MNFAEELSSLSPGVVKRPSEHEDGESFLFTPEYVERLNTAPWNLLFNAPVCVLKALDNDATCSIVWQGDYCTSQLTGKAAGWPHSNLQLRRSAVFESMLQPLETAGLTLYWGLVPLYTFICISQMCQDRGRLKTYKNASQIFLWVLQKGQRITGTVEVPGGDAAMRMLSHSCQLEILRWSGRGSLLQVLPVLLSICQLLSPVFSHIRFYQSVVVTSLAVPMETALSLEGDVECLSYESAFMG